MQNLKDSLKQGKGRVVNKDPTGTYIAIKPCGCVVAACVDRPVYQKETAKALAKWVRDGLTIERTTLHDAQKRLIEANASCRKDYRRKTNGCGSQ